MIQAQRPKVSKVVVACALPFVFIGCNAILDNERGNLVIPAEAGFVDDASENEPPVVVPDAAEPSPDAEPIDAGDETPDPSCPTGQRMCFGACVSLTDPLYGCGSPSCSPCASGHSTAACQGRTCVVAACDKGYADCNQKANDGCEVDLSKPASCGACNAVCGAATPLCAPSAGGFQCTNGCTPDAPLKCGGECVDPKISVNHCGGCNAPCPAVENATSSCAGGTCDFACKPSFHECTGKCVAKTDPSACGAACTPCPVPAGGTATCINDVCGATCPPSTHLCGTKCVAADDVTACGAACTVCPVPPNAVAASCTANACAFTCASGFGNCDGDPANGCETDLTATDEHCGACKMKCKKEESCALGVCTANEPPPPPPPPVP